MKVYVLCSRCGCGDPVFIGLFSTSGLAVQEAESLHRVQMPHGKPLKWEQLSDDWLGADGWVVMENFIAQG